MSTTGDRKMTHGVTTLRIGTYYIEPWTMPGDLSGKLIHCFYVRDLGMGTYFETQQDAVDAILTHGSWDKSFIEMLQVDRKRS